MARLKISHTFSAVLSDDDGLLVLASAAGLRRNYATACFDYAFPRALLADAASEAVCAWLTEVEGEVAISIRLDEAPRGIRCGVLRIEEADELLAIPYSAYTLMCDARRGEPDSNPRLCARFDVAPGRYEVHVDIATGVEELAFAVFLTPAAPEARSPGGIPKIPAP